MFNLFYLLYSNILKCSISYVDGEGDGGDDGDSDNGDSNDSKTVSVEEYNKLKTELTNSKGAFQSEREKRKTEKAELEKYRETEKKTKDSKAKKEGKYLDLISDRDTEISELKEKFKSVNEKAEQWDNFKVKQKEELETKFTELKGKLGKDILEKNSFILEDSNLGLEKQVKFLNNLIEISNPKDFGNKADKKGVVKPGDKTEQMEFDALQSRLDKGEKIKPSERGRFMILLKKLNK